MNTLKLMTVFSAFALASCAYQPTPYKVVQSTNYKQGELFGLYKLGVTEERVSKSEYVITVKLDSGSTPKRARNMLLLHAANLAISNNYEYFYTHKMAIGGWCQNRKNNKTNAVIFGDGGPRANAKIVFSHTKISSVKKKKAFNAKELSTRLEPIVHKVISKDEADINTNERMTVCWNNR